MKYSNRKLEKKQFEVKYTELTERLTKVHSKNLELAKKTLWYSDEKAGVLPGEANLLAWKGFMERDATLGHGIPEASGKPYRKPNSPTPHADVSAVDLAQWASEVNIPKAAINYAGLS